MKIRYIEKKFIPAHREIIAQANAFLDAYHAQGFTMTLRQVYYRFIATDVLPESWVDDEYNRRKGLAAGTKNTEKNYKKLGGILSDGRRAGLIDWALMEDRTRSLQSPTAWSSPGQIVAACAAQFDVDFWEDQPYRVEVWVEKQALAGVIEPVCEELHLPYFAARGYPSDSETQVAAQRLASYEVNEGKTPLILHLGDHDPSGKDMTRDIVDKMRLFASNTPCAGVEVRRLALNMDQVEQYDCPANPAKATDARHKRYAEEFGDESWELDALEPSVLADLIRNEVATLTDADAWADAERRRDEGRAQLLAVSDKWDEIVDGI